MNVLRYPWSSRISRSLFRLKNQQETRKRFRNMQRSCKRGCERACTFIRLQLWAPLVVSESSYVPRIESKSRLMTTRLIGRAPRTICGQVSETQICRHPQRGAQTQDEQGVFPRRALGGRLRTQKEAQNPRWALPFTSWPVKRLV
jgi:hypothetical protein